jgi:phosphate transport system permease protein
VTRAPQAAPGRTAAPDRSLAARVAVALEQHRGRPSGRLYPTLRWAGLAVFVGVAFALLVGLIWQASPAFAHAGLGFFFGGNWFLDPSDPARSHYGAGVFIVDTLLTTGLAMLLVIPIGVGTAALLSEFGPRWLAGALAAAIELLAAVPSVVVGLWAAIVLTPVFQSSVEPALAGVPLIGRLFHGPFYGSGILLASVVLAVMTLPTMVALTRTALGGVAVGDREAALALGATRWQVVRRAVIPGAHSGLRAAVSLAMGRALGEAFAVSMVIGAGRSLPHSLSAPGTTLGSAVVNFFGEATNPQDRSAVIALVVVLFIISALVNVVGQLLLRRRVPAARVLPPGPVDALGALPST